MDEELVTEADERLRSCPFCGSTTAPCVTRYWNDAVGCYEEHQWQVICNFNDGGCGGSSGVRDSEPGAIDAWNRRADD
jgi:hypothetical protein